jgi:FkbM family methyltransferase
LNLRLLVVAGVSHNAGIRCAVSITQGDKMIKTIKSYFRIIGLGGLFVAIKVKIAKTTALLQVKQSGSIKYPLYLRVPSSDVPTFRQIFIDQEYDFLVKNQPKVIIDAGANIGLASIYFSNKYPKAKIIAIEPERSNFELLAKNVAPYTNIIPIQAALWNQKGEISLVNPGLGNWGFRIEDENISESRLGSEYHKVASITIENIIEEYKLDKIDILKVDIEGSEKELFGETASWIEKVDALIIELHEYIKPGCNRSFYNGSNGFDYEWKQGENVYLSRGKCLVQRDAKLKHLE